MDHKHNHKQVASLHKKTNSALHRLAIGPCRLDYATAELLTVTASRLTGCPFVQVRRAMAEQLYLQMLAVQSEGESFADEDAATQELERAAAAYTSLQLLPAEDLEAALDVLLISAWDGPLEQVRASREELAAALHVEIKTKKVSRVLPDAGGAPGFKAVDQESYQSLLDDAARGGGY